MSFTSLRYNWYNKLVRLLAIRNLLGLPVLNTFSGRGAHLDGELTNQNLLWSLCLYKGQKNSRIKSISRCHPRVVTTALFRVPLLPGQCLPYSHQFFSEASIKTTLFLRCFYTSCTHRTIFS